jgi:hypothetical protein
VQKGLRSEGTVLGSGHEDRCWRFGKGFGVVTELRTADGR